MIIEALGRDMNKLFRIGSIKQVGSGFQGQRSRGPEVQRCKVKSRTTGFEISDTKGTDERCWALGAGQRLKRSNNEKERQKNKKHWALGKTK